jgi:ABC-type bacteriocin/lantibiotic exporter with double-glycine peptidase domain
VRNTAEVENNMNSVERLVHFATEIDQEAVYDLPEAQLHKSWLSVGGIEFSDVVLKYRPELPTVLKGLSMSIRGGEKIGVVGRYASSSSEF